MRSSGWLDVSWSWKTEEAFNDANGSNGSFRGAMVTMERQYR